MRLRKNQRNREIFGWWIIGTQQKDIADKFGLSRGRVCRIIKDETKIVLRQLQEKQKEERKDGKE